MTWGEFRGWTTRRWEGSRIWADWVEAGVPEMKGGEREMLLHLWLE